MHHSLERDTRNLPKTERFPLFLQLHTSRGRVPTCCASQKASMERAIVDTCVAVNRVNATIIVLVDRSG